MVPTKAGKQTTQGVLTMITRTVTTVNSLKWVDIRFGQNITFAESNRQSHMDPHLHYSGPICIADTFMVLPHRYMTFPLQWKQEYTATRSNYEFIQNKYHKNSEVYMTVCDTDADVNILNH